MSGILGSSESLCIPYDMLASVCPVTLASVLSPLSVTRSAMLLLLFSMLFIACLPGRSFHSSHCPFLPIVAEREHD